MHESRPSIRDAGADSVCAFDPLRPDAAQPYTPLLELLVLALVATMVDGDSVAVAQQNYVRLRANNGIEAVYLFLGLEQKVMQRFARDSELTLCEQVGY
jgi:hypothetical protein